MCMEWSYDCAPSTIYKVIIEPWNVRVGEGGYSQVHIIQRCSEYCWQSGMYNVMQTKKHALFVMLVGNIHQFEAYWIRCVRYAYESLWWLDLEMWRFLCSRSHSRLDSTVGILCRAEYAGVYYVCQSIHTCLRKNYKCYQGLIDPQSGERACNCHSAGMQSVESNVHVEGAVELYQRENQVSGTASDTLHQSLHLKQSGTCMYIIYTW